MADVTLLILQDHETLRRMFAELEGLRDNPTQAGDLWADLAALLEMHASAEEEHFYPALLQHVPGSADETRDAIGDHDEIRDGIRHTQSAEVGSEQWWKGVEETRDANQEHLAEEERDDLADCLQYMSHELRAELGERFQAFKNKHPHARGLSSERSQNPSTSPTLDHEPGCWFAPSRPSRVAGGSPMPASDSPASGCVGLPLKRLHSDARWATRTSLPPALSTLPRRRCEVRQ